MTKEEREVLEAQKRYHIADLLKQYEGNEQLTKKTALIKAGLSLIFESMHISDSGHGDYGGGGTHGPSETKAD